MGPSQQKGEFIIQNPNDYFLSMLASPQSNSLKVEVNVRSMTILNKWSQNLQKLHQISSENILLPKQYKIMERSLCGQNFRLQIEYQCYHILLSQEIQKRREADKYLQEAQMWYLVYCLAEAANSCHKLGYPIGDVRLQNLLLNKGGNLKILSSMSVPTSKDLYAEDKSSSKLFFSPQELQSLKKSYKQSHLNYIRSESFSIGVTILATGILQNLSTCYNYPNSELNMLEFNKALTFWHQNQFYSESQQKNVIYSKQLKDIVINLLELDPERRMTSLDVYELLSRHREDIMKLQPFQLNFEKLSPKKKMNASNSMSNEGIHILRSKKASQKGSPKKSQKVQVSSFNHVEGDFSFNNPSLIQSANSNIYQTSPVTKKKINISFGGINQQRSAGHK